MSWLFHGVLICLSLSLVPLATCDFINCLSFRLTSNGTSFRYQSLKDYTSDVCSKCYAYMIIPAFRPQSLVRRNNGTTLERPFFYAVVSTRDGDRKGALCNERGCLSLDPQNFNRSHPSEDLILGTFANDFYMEVFVKCCEDAVKCCNETLSASVQSSGDDDPNYCPAKWDGWTCWDRAKAGSTATQTCPLAALQVHHRALPACLRGHAEKKCGLDGQWYRLIEQGSRVLNEKTNYEYCSFVGRDKSMREIQLRTALHSVSLVFVAVSCGIFIAYKQYRIVRVKVHLNFFLSLALTAISDLLLFLLVRRRHFEPNDNVLKTNASWCIFLTVFVKFARLTNYCWMLCEGLYLHKLIVHAFHEQTRTLHFYVVGWILPVIAMIPYVIVHDMKQYNEKCWIESMGNMEWIHYPWPMLSLIVNCILLGNIIRALCTKLRASPEHFRAALRATLFLVPVFGIHYIFYVSKGGMLETCDAFLNFLFYLGIAVDCLQGAIVATIFCLLNAEVHSLIRKTIRRRFRVPEIVTEERDLGKSVSSNNHLSLSASLGRQ